jgi:hypothetical protein
MTDLEQSGMVLLRLAIAARTTDGATEARGAPTGVASPC